MFLLDTNVISEAVKPQPDERVGIWIQQQSPVTLHLSVITLGEIMKGIAGLAPGYKREMLEEFLTEGIPSMFGDQILPFDDRCTIAWGELAAQAKKDGRPLSVADPRRDKPRRSRRGRIARAAQPPCR